MNLLSLFIAFCAAALFALFVFWTEPLGFLPALERLTPNIVYRVRTRQPLVALSFDDGPHPTFTPQVLDILQRHNAKATFFLIGERASRHPEVVAAIRAAGHEIGNHYSSDISTLSHSDAKFLRNLDQAESALGIATKPGFNPSLSFRAEQADFPFRVRSRERVGLRSRGISLPAPSGADVDVPSPEGSPPESTSPLKLFRPPGGVAWPRQIRLACERGYACVLGCAYPHDPMHPPVWYIRWLIEKNLVPGSIVILHDGISDPSRSLQALPHILEAAHKKGLRLVSISELLRAAGSFSL